MEDAPQVRPGDFIYFGNGVRAIVRRVFAERQSDGAQISAVINPHNPAAYDFRWQEGKWDLIEQGGGSYVRPGREDWTYAVELRKLAGIKNPERY